jgi:hypothetical protein
MAVNDPRKKFAYRLIVTDPDGRIWDSLEFQKCKLPEPKLATATHGAGGSLIETPGMQGVLTMTAEMIIDSVQDTKVKDWYNKAKKRGPRAGYVKTAVLEELSADMETVIEQHKLIEIFPKSYARSEFDSKNEADNTTISLEFSVRDMI